MRNIFILAVLPCCACGQQWTPIPSSTITPAVPSAVESGANRLQGREFLVQGTYLGKHASGQLLLYFDPATQSFVWRFAPLWTKSGTLTVDAVSEGVSVPSVGRHLASDSAGFVFAAHDGVFLFESGTSLRVTPPAGTASSLDDAQSQALRLLTSHLANVSGLGLVRPEASSIGLHPLLRVVPASIFYLRIQSVTRQASGWQVTIQIFDKVVSLDVDPSWKISKATVISVVPKK